MQIVFLCIGEGIITLGTCVKDPLITRFLANELVEMLPSFGKWKAAFSHSYSSRSRIEGENLENSILRYQKENILHCGTCLLTFSEPWFKFQQVYLCWCFSRGNTVSTWFIILSGSLHNRIDNHLVRYFVSLESKLRLFRGLMCHWRLLTGLKIIACLISMI